MQNTKKFQKRIEDFECEHCKTEVTGNGYTNHCPMCLWSKHVDINPGDRAEKCNGMMRPMSVEKKGDDFIIIHKCEKCGFERKKIVEKDDNFDAVIGITKK